MNWGTNAHPTSHKGRGRTDSTEKDMANWDLSEQCGAHLAIKAVDGVHAARLVVASGQVHVLWIQPLESKQREDHFC